MLEVSRQSQIKSDFSQNKLNLQRRFKMLESINTSQSLQDGLERERLVLCKT